MTSLKDLRNKRAKHIKHVAVVRLTNAEEEQILTILEKQNIGFSTYVNMLVRKALTNISTE